MIFEVEGPCTIDRAKEYIAKFSYWFTSYQGTFVSVYGAYKPPWLMLKYVTDKVFMKEFGYQLCTRLSQQLQMSNKSPWPIFPLQIGLYELKNLKEIEVDIKELNSLTCDRMSFHQYDPRDV